MSAIVSIQNINKSFSDTSALNNVSFEIQSGEFFGLLGVNGAGKSTLINIMAGLTKPDSGNITVDGFDVQKDYRNARRALGVVPQELVYDPFFTVRELLQLQSGYFGIKNNQNWIGEVITELKLTDKMNSNIQSLSGGMKRRLLIAQALMHRPKVLVLDEPTAGVDVDLRLNLWKFIKRLNQQGTTVILTTHYLEEAENLCDKIAVLDDGKLITLEDKSRLLAKIPHQNISFKTDSPLPAALSHWRAKTHKGTTTIQILVDDQSQIAKLMADLTKQNIPFSDLQIKKPSLEEIFLAITRH